MKLVKSLFLGSAAALVAGAGAQAADLPARKAAPVEYVKVCDAYGAGFFFIPGTETCIKVGGRVRADFAASGRQSIYSGGTINGTTGALVNTLSRATTSQNVYGWEARGRVDLDARTQTPWGTVQAVAALRLARTTGILDNQGPNPGSLAGTNTAAPNANNASSTLEAAYIRFAGFTFGAARDNFSFMPSTFYGSGHWASFANGAKQIAYTAILGGGFSATVAMQDAADTTLGGTNTQGFINPITGLYDPTGLAAGIYAFNSMPQFNGRLDYDQSWGTASLMGAVGRAVDVTNTGTNTLGTVDLNTEKTVWAIGAGMKFNLPMIAAGDVLYLNGAYANGMTEYTVNWTYFKGSDTKRNTGGFVNNTPSWVNYLDAAGNAQIQTLKSWNLAALYTHYWTPQWRNSFLATGGRVEGTSLTNAVTFGNGGAYGDQTVWNIGTQLAFLPAKDFEIGVDILYNRVSQDVRRTLVTGTSGAFCNGTTGAGCVTRESTGNWSGRLRVERTF